MLIVSKDENEVLKSIKYLLDQERMEYDIESSYKNNNYNKVILITNNINDIPNNIKEDLLIITDNKIDIKDITCKSNEIITKLINDNNSYTEAQEEYLFRDGIYSIINEIVLSFIKDNTIDKMIYDTSSCDIKPKDWIFKFDSLAESYAWLARKNSRVKVERKVIEIANDIAFNDSDKEITYLSDYILLAKKGIKITTIYVGTKEDVEEKEKNRFFDMLARKCGENIKMYYCDINVLEEKEPELLNKIRDGLAIYDDCIYKDTFSSEFSLGIVDCKIESVNEYSDIFDYILDNYSVKLVEGGEYVRI